MLSFILDILLAGLAGYMLIKGHYATTRQGALVLAAAALLDAGTVGAVDAALTPVLSALLLAVQLVLLASGAALLRRDRVRARNKRARRQRRLQVEASRAAFLQVGQRHSAPAHRVCA